MDGGRHVRDRPRRAGGDGDAGLVDGQDARVGVVGLALLAALHLGLELVARGPGEQSGDDDGRDPSRRACRACGIGGRRTSVARSARSPGAARSVLPSTASIIGEEPGAASDEEGAALAVGEAGALGVSGLTDERVAAVRLVRGSPAAGAKESSPRTAREYRGRSLRRTRPRTPLPPRARTRATSVSCERGSKPHASAMRPTPGTVTPPVPRSAWATGEGRSAATSTVPSSRAPRGTAERTSTGRCLRPTRTAPAAMSAARPKKRAYWRRVFNGGARYHRPETWPRSAPRSMVGDGPTS